MILKYLFALLTHKYYVFIAGRRLGGVSLWRLIIHDWSKFLLFSEFLPYARYDFSDKSNNTPQVQARFDLAWLHHIHLNQHHWQHWILRQNQDGVKALPMPEPYIMEMIADWMGAGRAYTGSWDMAPWLDENLANVLNNMHEDSQRLVKRLLLKHCQYITPKPTLWYMQKP